MRTGLLLSAAFLLLLGSVGCNGINLAGGTCGNCGGGGCRGGGLLGGGGLGGRGGGFAGGPRAAGDTRAKLVGAGKAYTHHNYREYDGPPGPPTAAVGYPYYTTRAPRDFLVDNPPSLGK